MTAYKPWLQDMTEAQFRQWLAYTFEQSATGVAKTGVLSGLGVTPTTPAPSGSVVVGKGAAVCQPSSQAFPLVEPADETFDVFTANPMQFVNNPRNDIIVLDQVTGLVTNLVGEPNAIPSAGEQAVPATAVPLARLRHDANATTIPASAIDDLRVFTYFFGAASKPAAYLEKTTSGNVTTNTLVDLVWETRAASPGVTTTATTVTPGRAGYYVVEGYISWTSSSGGWRGVQVLVDGAAVARSDIPGAAAQSGGVAFEHNFSIPFRVPTATGVVKLQCAYDGASPAALQVLTGTRAALRFVADL